MKFSFVVPIYNIQDYLIRCLQSISEQTFTDFEVLLIDDDSKDSSSKIAELFEKKDERFKYYHKENGGAASSRNYGIRKANGKYILFVDGDDYISKDMLSIMDKITKHKEYDVLEFNAYIDNMGQRSAYNQRYKNMLFDQSGRNYLISHLDKYGCLYVVPWNKLIRRKFLLDNNIFFEDGRLYEDELWTPQLLLSAGNVRYINEYLYSYVTREGSAVHRKVGKKDLFDSKNNYIYLERVYNKSNLSKQQKRILLSFLSREYMWACINYGKGNLTYFDRKFVSRNAKKPLVKFEALLFNISPFLLDAVIKNVKKIRKIG